MVRRLIRRLTLKGSKRFFFFSFFVLAGFYFCQTMIFTMTTRHSIPVIVRQSLEDRLENVSIAESTPSPSTLTSTSTVPSTSTTEIEETIENYTRISKVAYESEVEFGRTLPNCGRGHPCDAYEIPVAVYSGTNKDDEPMICINGTVMMARNLNEGGRGLNVVVLSADTLEVVSVGHFDTYAEDSIPLESFLQELVDGDIVIVVSFDEASKQLSSTAKQLFYDLGSAFIQDIKFRASWYLVGQKGIASFSTFEELNFPNGDKWAKEVDKRLCISANSNGFVHSNGKARRRNDARRTFCDKYDGFEDFCEENLDRLIRPTPIENDSMVDHPIFRVPILVVAGLSRNSLRLSLESVVAQPGLIPDSVLVTYDANYVEYGELARLFHFRAKSIGGSASYSVHLAKSIDHIWSAFPNASVAIVIEEDLTLKPDFLSFMAEMLPLLQGDENISAISASDAKGFKSATLPNLVHRSDGFPGLGFMIRKSTYMELMKGKMDLCCSKRAWEGWKLAQSGVHIIVPDKARVIRRHVDGFKLFDQSVKNLFRWKQG